MVAHATRVDQFKIALIRLDQAFDAITGNPRCRIDNRYALARKPIEKG